MQRWCLRQLLEKGVICEGEETSSTGDEDGDGSSDDSSCDDDCRENSTCDEQAETDD